jgi:hypothetical protein
LPPGGSSTAHIYTQTIHRRRVPSHLARLLPHSLIPLINFQYARKKQILILYKPTFDDADAFNERVKRKVLA